MCLAIPGYVESVDESKGALARTGQVSFAGVRRKVNLSLVPEALAGDYVLVHVGVALQRINADEAHRVFELLDEMGEVAQELGPETPEDPEPRNKE